MWFMPPIYGVFVDGKQEFGTWNPSCSDSGHRSTHEIFRVGQVVGLSPGAGYRLQDAAVYPYVKHRAQIRRLPLLPICESRVTLETATGRCGNRRQLELVSRSHADKIASICVGKKCHEYCVQATEKSSRPLAMSAIRQQDDSLTRGLPLSVS